VAGTVRVRRDDAVRWLERRRAPFDLIVEDLSVIGPRGATKPTVSYGSLPRRMRAALGRGGVALVMTDWAMPVVDGLQLLRKIRQADSPTCNIPFLMITAADTTHAIVEAGKEGVDAYVIKPFSVATISDKIQEAIEKRAAS